MAIFTDGTTTLTVNFVDESVEPTNEQSTNRTAGGSDRTVIGGERMKIRIEARLTPAQYRSLINIYNSTSGNLYYTPNDTTETFWTALYPDITFPLNSRFFNMKRNWDNRKY